MPTVISQDPVALEDTTEQQDRSGRPLVLAVELPDSSFEVKLPDEGHVIIGRSRAADVHIAHPSISRQHARLRLGAEPTIKNLRARNGVFVRDRRLGDDEEVPVPVGAEIELGEVIVTLRRQRPPRSPSAKPRCTPTATDFARIRSATRLRTRLTSWRPRPAASVASTAPHADDPLPRKVIVQVLARGGKVTFELDQEERVAYLAERRLDLLILLLRPPAPLQPGDPVPDEILLRTIWPRNRKASRVDVNTLIARTRKALLNAGIDGNRILRRTPGGGATQLVLETGAQVVVDA